MSLATEEAGTGRRARLELASLLLGVFLGAVLLVSAFRGPRTNFEELAFGTESRGYYAREGAYPIHCRDMTDAQECVDGFRARGSSRGAVWLGNSQLQGVNQMKEGDESAPPILARSLRERGVDLVAFSPSNGTLEEHLLLFAWLKDRLPLELLILPLVFDDTRTYGVRASLRDALQDPRTVAVLERSEPGRGMLEQQQTSDGDELAALDETVQDRAEAWLTGWLERNSTLWETRREARGTIYSFVRDLRNSVFRIDAQSKRRLLEGPYRRNLAAARATLEEAQRDGIPVLTYIAPLRDDVETPYVDEEYARFKRDAEAMAADTGAFFLNLEDLVPGPLWGTTASKSLGEAPELDFMHFQAGGHALLASAVFAALEENGIGNAR